jgi:hypothetical protein
MMQCNNLFKWKTVIEKFLTVLEVHISQKSTH